ncbi:MAG: hypothetical protein WDN69_34350 [Aliidongia sp.]
MRRGCCRVANPLQSRQALSTRLDRERDDQQAEQEGGGGPGDRRAERAHFTYRRTEREIHSGTDEPPDRSAEGEGGGAHLGAELLRQPQAEHGKIAARHAEEKQDAEEPGQRLAGRQVEGPTRSPAQW